MSIPRGYVAISVVGTVCGCTVLLKDWIGGKHYKNEEKVVGKTAIVTGANSGIGKETTRELAKRGARVIMACRDLNKCDIARKEITAETFNRNVECRQLDLASIASIRAFAKRMNQDEKHIDILVNNAGVMGCPKTLTQDGFEWQFGVNHLGPFLLTNLLVDKLKESGHARIINLTSPLYRKAKINFEDINYMTDYDPRTSYGQSKLANVLFTTELAQRLKDSNVTVNCVNPGVVNTSIGRHSSMAKSTISGGMVYPLVWAFLKTPSQGAQGVLYCALEPSLEKVSGKYFKNQKEETLVGVGADGEAAKRLWLVSEKWTRLT